MSDAWGGSWGDAWGGSWGLDAPSAGGRRPSAVRIKSQAYADPQAQRIADDDALLLVIAQMIAAGIIY